MSYIDKHLMDGETVAARKRLHWIVFLKPLVVAFFAFAIIACGLIIDSNVLVLIGGFVLLLAVAWWAVVFVRWISTEFAVTNRRLIRKAGVLSHTSRELHLFKVESVEVEQSLIGRMLGFGRMLVSGTGGLHHVFDVIPDPLQFRKEIQRQIERDQRKDEEPGR